MRDGSRTVDLEQRVASRLEDGRHVFADVAVTLVERRKLATGDDLTNIGGDLMKRKGLFASLPLVMTILTCPSTHAQSSLNPTQARSLAPRHQQDARAIPESSLSPLLGSPRDYEGGDALSSPQGDAAARHSQPQDEKSTSESTLSPLFGAPQDYEDFYQSHLDDGLHGESPADGNNSSSTVVTNHGDANSKHAVGKRRNSLKLEAVSALSESPPASPFDSVVTPTGGNSAAPVYRSPW
jgi:hypothetical protein